ncbi:MAG: hypothetical protein Q7U57_13445 [Methylovulum sp.]|nr:hypothetical protein [Methylovulum sp.]
MSVGASLTAVMLVPIVLVLAEIAVVPLLTEEFRVTRVSEPAVAL